MLRIVQLEQVEALLLQLPGLVQQQELRNPNFPSRVRDWLTSLEAELMANRLHQAGAIATLRSALIAADHGEVPAGVTFRSRPTRSRVMNAVASQSLQRAAEVAAPIIKENRARISDAERVAHQVIAAAFSRGLVSVRSLETNNTQYLRNLRQALATSGDLESAVVHVEGLVGPHDILVLLDRALALHYQAIQ